MKKTKIDDLFYQNLTDKQKENLKKIKEFLEKENQKAREHQKIRGGALMLIIWAFFWFFYYLVANQK